MFIIILLSPNIISNITQSIPSEGDIIKYNNLQISNPKYILYS
jgi:hypothetical protein